MATVAVPTPKQQFLDAYLREGATTLRVLRAYPTDKSELRPHRMCKTARELAWMFVLEQGMSEKALTTGFDWSVPPAMPPAPASLEEVIAAFEGAQQRVASLVRDFPAERLSGTVQFFTGPKTLGDLPLAEVLWMFLCDQIHHRGQFSIYLRMADGKVPSIYGPTADEPWM
jgi:uncharacterized damage-inducible protein DinB